MSDQPFLPSPQLAYAPPRPLTRRLMRRLGVFLPLAAVVISGYWWIPRALHTGMVCYWQSKCSEYRASPDAVVAKSATTNPSAAKIAVVPKPWAKFYELLSPPGMISEGTAFLHQIQRSDGEPVLVGVDMYTTPNDRTVYFILRAYRPGTLLRPPEQVQQTISHFTHTEGYTLYAGQLDPADPTHFVLRLTTDRRTHVFDGWARKEIILEDRAAATPPPPP
jgi:hypothetical protein